MIRKFTIPLKCIKILHWTYGIKAGPILYKQDWTEENRLIKQKLGSKKDNTITEKP